MPCFDDFRQVGPEFDRSDVPNVKRMSNGSDCYFGQTLKTMCLFLENFSKRLKITGCSVPRCRHSLDPPGTDPPAAAQPSPHPVEERTGELGEDAEPETKNKGKVMSYERLGHVIKQIPKSKFILTLIQILNPFHGCLT